MTSRTTDIHCRNCRKYLFSVVFMDDKVHYCNTPQCKEAATAAKLRGEKVKIDK